MVNDCNGMYKTYDNFISYLISYCLEVQIFGGRNRTSHSPGGIEAEVGSELAPVPDVIAVVGALLMSVDSIVWSVVKEEFFSHVSRYKLKIRSSYIKKSIDRKTKRTMDARETYKGYNIYIR